MMMNTSLIKMTDRLPWHQSLWQQMHARWQQDHLPHALLLTGYPGMGKYLFAQQLTKTLLCHALSETVFSPCGRCKPCHLFDRGYHPDFLLLQPNEAGKTIQINVIRELIAFSRLTPHYNRVKIAVIYPAEAMNRQAANSLLKLLEEPPAEMIFFLVSHQPQRLPATLHSRCQTLNFNRPDKTAVHTWLQTYLPDASLEKRQLLLDLSAQAPLAALRLQKTLSNRCTLFDSLIQLLTSQPDPIAVADEWQTLEPTATLTWLISWTEDLIRYTLSGQIQVIRNRDYKDTLLSVAAKINLRHLFDLLDLQQQALQLINSTTVIKPAVLLESIAIAWFESTS